MFKDFFKSIIDYAGLFPPAKLPLDEALKNYRLYLNRDDSWALSKFILPVSRINDVSDGLLSLFSKEKKLSLSLISRDPKNEASIIDKWASAHSEIVSVDSLEIPIAADVEFSPTLSALEVGVKSVNESMPIFLELAPSPDWDEKLKGFVEAVSAFNQEATLECGVKLRCGGVEPHMIPSVEQVASSIQLSASHQLPMKFTAGLHHPFRHHSESLGVLMHGYFNIFFGTMLFFAGKINNDELCSFLSDTENTNVDFSSEAISWGGKSLLREEVIRLREDAACSYGSCSFLEPLEDAEKLGWL